jgi:hypothetical protein
MLEMHGHPVVDISKVRKLGRAMLRRSQISDTYKRVYATPDGRLMIHDLLKRAGILEVATVGGDPYMTHFRDGRRSLAQEVMDELRFDVNRIIELAAEREARESEPDVFQRGAA